MTYVYHTEQPSRVHRMTLAPREAVLTCYAQSLNDWDHWGYEQRYGHLLREFKNLGWMCGPFWAGNACAIPQGYRSKRDPSAPSQA